MTSPAWSAPSSACWAARTTWSGANPLQTPWRSPREFNPDLVILDIRMPELDGFELMARLKADQPDVDIILMTGSLDDLDQKLIRAIRGRAFYFIQKPFDREVLQTLVERCLELRWRREENRRHVHRLEQELGEARGVPAGPPAGRRNGHRSACRSVPDTCPAPSSAAISVTTFRSAREGWRCSSPTSWVTASRRRC